jgi:hypothetical protein
LKMIKSPQHNLLALVPYFQLSSRSRLFVHTGTQTRKEQFSVALHLCQLSSLLAGLSHVAVLFGNNKDSSCALDLTFKVD